MKSRSAICQIGSDEGWKGIFPSLCTPFHEGGAIDPREQRAVVEFALSCGVSGIVSFGLAGEVNKLTVEERKKLCDVILETADGRVPVIVGVGAEAEHTAVALTRYAENAGADGIVIPPPRGTGTRIEVLEHYFLSVASSTRLPVVIQDAPAHLRVALSPELVGRLAAVQTNIRYVKLEAGPEETARWADHLFPQVHVFTGDAGLYLIPSLRAGAVGNMPGVEIADHLVAAYDAERHGKIADANSLHNRLLPYLIFTLQTLDHYIACSKEVLVRRGVISRALMRMPAPPITSLTLEILEKHLLGLGILSPAR